jgi:hemolysin D
MHAAAEALLARRPPIAVRGLLYPIGVMLVAGIAWASVAEVDRVVVTSGRVVTTERPLVAQAFERSVIRAIAVSPGQRVARGDVLATLDATPAEAAERELAARRARLAAQEARLAAELEGRAFAGAEGAAEALEARLSAQRVGTFAERVAAFDAAERRFATRAESLGAHLRALESRLAIAREIEGMRATLRARDAGPHLALLQAQWDRVGVEEAIATTRAEIEDQRRQAEGSRAERAAFALGWREEVAARLVETRRELDGVTEQLGAAMRRRELAVLRAPADGVVLEVARRSAGSVAQEAETLVTLVPSDTALEAEVAIGPADAGHVLAGATARVKLEALSYQRHGVLPATVREVDADAVPAEDGRRRHRARVALDPGALRNAPPGFRLMPGMEVAAEVVVGRRTILSYLLDPVLRLGEDGFRER